MSVGSEYHDSNAYKLSEELESWAKLTDIPDQKAVMERAAAMLRVLHRRYKKVCQSKQRFDHHVESMLL